MLIKNIEVQDVAQLDPTNGDAQGIVAFFTEDSIIHIACRSPNLISRSADALRRHLINDGVRQLARMPEFRAGRTQFSFAPGLV
jgi:hypothetical protein